MKQKTSKLIICTTEKNAYKQMKNALFFFDVNNQFYMIIMLSSFKASECKKNKELHHFETFILP